MLCERDKSLLERNKEIREREKRGAVLDELCEKAKISTRDKKEIYTIIENERSRITALQQINETLSKKVLSLYEEIVKIRQQLTSVMEKYATTLSLQKQTENAIEIHIMAML